MKPVTLAASLAALALLTGAAQAQPAPPAPYGMPIDGDQAQLAMTAAEAEARQNNWTLSFVVVDTSGNLVMAKRMPNAPPFTVEVAMKKAKTAAMLRAPSKTMADMAAAGGPPVWLALDMFPADGGLPIVVGGKFIGAIGASGATGAQDAQAAAKGVAAVR